MLKTTTFAIMHFSIAFGVTYAITGDLVLGGLIAVIEPAANTVAYFFHEKIWQRLQHQQQARQSTSIYNNHFAK
ncbi:membrane protein [Arsukibacterium ikkense]|uniref:Membrane protein n=1 Tax=Arsukibacterium ikkense TaxID=336831 RepID=A0A0M2V6B2_9GAMM|nr:DUF2061 domain-containing protein [Arsukibacterium ikkense]KKO46166.1 membrane protein [Arsukibacterium ikkense]